MIGEAIQEDVLRALVEQHAVRECWWPRSPAALRDAKLVPASAFRRCPLRRRSDVPFAFTRLKIR